jgi:hypothetical protein
MSRNDFHNGRSYAADPPEGPAGMFGWLKALAGRLFREASAPTEIPPIATAKDTSPFSLLGASEQDLKPYRSGTPVFPMADWATRSPAPLHRRRTGRSRPAAPSVHDQDR